MSDLGAARGVIGGPPTIPEPRWARQRPLGFPHRPPVRDAPAANSYWLGLVLGLFRVHIILFAHPISKSPQWMLPATAQPRISVAQALTSPVPIRWHSSRVFRISTIHHDYSSSLNASRRIIIAQRAPAPRALDMTTCQLSVFPAITCEAQSVVLGLCKL